METRRERPGLKYFFGQEYYGCTLISGPDQPENPRFFGSFFLFVLASETRCYYLVVS